MSDLSTERAIGRLEQGMETLTRAVERGQNESREGRARIYSELEAIRQDAADRLQQITALKDRIEADASFIADIRKWKERVIGMQILVVAAATAVGGGVALVWKWISVKIGFN